jgi:hypothetical protein
MKPTKIKYKRYIILLEINRSTFNYNMFPHSWSRGKVCNLIFVKNWSSGWTVKELEK